MPDCKTDFGSLSLSFREGWAVRGTVAERDCLSFHDHTRCPDGYIQWHEWARRMGKTHRQIKCAACGLYAIWIERPQESLTRDEWRTMMDCGEWQPYFALWPVYVDAYNVSEIKYRKMRYLKLGWVERRLDIWIDNDDEDRVEHRVWRFRLSRQPS